MYINSSIQSYERANARARGLPDLPQYPGDGNTRCLTNCQCHLSYEWADGAWLVYWNLGQAEHCPDCEAMASDWSPLEILAEGEFRGQLPTWEGDPNERELLGIDLELEDAAKAWLDSLSPAEYDALEDYMVAGYDDINKALLRGESDPRARFLERLLRGAPNVDQVVWRGRRSEGSAGQIDWARAVGTVLDWKTFASASLDPWTAVSFGDLVFELRGRSGKRLQDITGFQELEVLFPPGTRWRVAETRDIDIVAYGDTWQTTLIVLEEL